MESKRRNDRKRPRIHSSKMSEKEIIKIQDKTVKDILVFFGYFDKLYNDSINWIQAIDENIQNLFYSSNTISEDLKIIREKMKNLNSLFIEGDNLYYVLEKHSYVDENIRTEWESFKQNFEQITIILEERQENYDKIYEDRFDYEMKELDNRYNYEKYSRKTTYEDYSLMDDEDRIIRRIESGNGDLEGF